MMDPVSASFENWAFGLVSLTCATGYYSFGHELGHNMSAHHDWFANSATTPFPYNHGYVNVDEAWRTIMAYNSECDSHNLYCDRLPYWSNPDVSYNDAPMGVPPGTSTSCQAGDPNHPDCDADNRLVLNNTAPTVANFRDSASCTGEGPVLFSSYLVDDDNSGDSSGNGDGVADCGETIELYVDLYNHGDHSVSGVSAAISTTDPGITWPYNSASDYPAISSQTASTNKNDYDLVVDPNTPNGHVINLNLDITISGGGPWSDTFDLAVTCCPKPGTPSLTAPSDSVVIQDPRPTFEWVDLPDTNEYQIEIATDPGFSNMVISEGVPSSTYTPAVVLDNNTYYWRTAGRNLAQGCDIQGDYSDTWSVTIDSRKVYLPALKKQD
jgi:hypothetical protein